MPSHNLLDALRNCLLLRAAGCHAPPVLRAFWEVPSLEADDTCKAWSQAVSAEGAEIVVGYDVLTESRKRALPWKTLLQLAPDRNRQVAPLKQRVPKLDMLRRTNMLGQLTSSQYNVDGLVSVFLNLNEHPAFEEVLEAVATYSEHLQDTCAPADAFHSCSWLQLNNEELSTESRNVPPSVDFGFLYALLLW